MCLDNFLDILETTCSAFVQLSLIDSPYLTKMVRNFLPSLKHHIDKQLPGNVMRKEMLEIIFSGQFPKKSRKDFEIHGQLDEGIFQSIKKLKINSENCVGICCSGWFVVETMACVLINDQTKELIFNFDFSEMMMKRRNKEDLCDSVSFDVPSIMENYFNSVKENYCSKKLKPQLEIMVMSQDLRDRDGKNTNGRYYDKVLNTFEETKAYKRFPRLLSSASSKPYASKVTTPCVEDLVMVLTDVFGLGKDVFEKLTTLDLWFHSLPLENDDDLNVLFTNIGKSCPNLKDLSAPMSPDRILYLLFRDPCESIKGFIKADGDGATFKLLDDRLYDLVLQKHKKEDLKNVYKTGEFVDFIFQMKKEDLLSQHLNKLSSSLQYFDFRILYWWLSPSSAELYTMLMCILENIKSFGSNDDVLNGLNLLQKVTAHSDSDKEFDFNLEEIRIRVVRKENTYKRRGFSNANDLKQFYIRHSSSDVFEDETVFEEETQEIENDLSYLSLVCPDIKHMVIEVQYFKNYDEEGNEIYEHIDENEPIRTKEPVGILPWEPLLELKGLKSMNIQCFCWNDVYSLFCVVGKKLKSLVLETQHHSQPPEDSQPPLDVILQLFPNIEEITLKLEDNFKISNSESIVNLSKLKKLILFNSFNSNKVCTRETFLWIWSRSKSLNVLDIHEIDNKTFSREDIDLLLESNPKLRIEKFKVKLIVDTIETARVFVDSLRDFGVEEIETIEITLHVSDVRRQLQNIVDWLDHIETLKNPTDGKQATLVKCHWNFVGDLRVLPRVLLDWMSVRMGLSLLFFAPGPPPN